MKKYERMPLRIEHMPEAGGSWPQTVRVPGGCEFMTYYGKGYQHSCTELEIDLYCSGDWVEVVDVNGNLRTWYVID